MLNLGHVGRLSLEMPVEARQRLLLHLAVELSTTSRAHVLDVIVHGFAGALSPLERLHFCADQEDFREAIDRYSAWDLEPGTGGAVALSLDAIEGEGTIPQENPAFALVSPDDARADWTLRDMDGRLHLEPAGLELRPLELEPDELELIGELVLQAKKAPERPAVEEEPVSNGREEAIEDVIDLDGDGDAVEAKPIEARILGPVEVVGAEGLTSAKAEELIVYLATHRRGATIDELQEALWPDETPSPGRLHTTAWRARQSLGDGPDGEPVLPKVVSGRYALSSEVGTDYERFRAHVARARLAPTDAIDELRAALDLVRGEPYAGTATEYTWASYEVHTIAQEVGDAAHWLAQLLLDEGEPSEARWAAEQGLLADPYMEALYRDLMEAAAAKGNTTEVQAVMKRLRHVIAGDAESNDADDRMNPDTIRTYERLTQTRSVNSL